MVLRNFRAPVWVPEAFRDESEADPGDLASAAVLAGN